MNVLEKTVFPAGIGNIQKYQDFPNLKPIKICSYDDPYVDLDLFYGKVKFCNLGFKMGQSDNDEFIGNYCSL